LAKQFFRLYGPSGKNNIAAGPVCIEPVSMELENAGCKFGCKVETVSSVHYKPPSVGALQGNKSDDEIISSRFCDCRLPKSFLAMYM